MARRHNAPTDETFSFSSVRTAFTGMYTCPLLSETENGGDTSETRPRDLRYDTSRARYHCATPAAHAHKDVPQLKYWIIHKKRDLCCQGFRYPHLHPPTSDFHDLRTSGNPSYHAQALVCDKSSGTNRTTADRTREGAEVCQKRESATKCATEICCFQIG